MARLAIPPRDDAPEASRPALDRIYGRLGSVPGVFRLLGSSPSVLEGYLALAEALGGVLDAKLRIRIAIAVSQANGCDYCLSANHYAALNAARIGPEEVALNRQGRSQNARAAVVVGFAASVVRARGRVADEEVAAVRAAGFSDREIVEIVALAGMASFTNLLNEVARTEIDFPLLRSTDLPEPSET